MSSFIKKHFEKVLLLYKELGDADGFAEFQVKNQEFLRRATALEIATSMSAASKLVSTDYKIAWEQATTQLYSMCGWAQHGYNILAPSADLLAALMCTDVSKVFVGQRLPYRSVLVDLTPLAPEWAVIHDGKELLRCHYGTITEIHQENGPLAWVVGLLGGGWVFTVAEEECFFMHVDNSRSLLEIVDAEQRGLAIMCRLAASLVCWWNSPVNDAHKQIKFGHQKREARLRPTRWLLGKSVKIHSKIIAQSRQNDAGLRQLLETQHVVRGHFKQQAHGQGRLERKTIWVEPYWRGPDSEEAWVHVYQNTRS